MSKETIIRNEQRTHEVKLGHGEQVAQSPRPDMQAMDIPPPIARKPAAGSTRATTRKSADTPPTAPATTATRKKARLGAGDAATPARKRAAPAKPRLPARVPADRLWEDDSAVMQRLNALQQHNARLAEQLQRLAPTAPLKGFQP